MATRGGNLQVLACFSNSKEIRIVSTLSISVDSSQTMRFKKHKNIFLSSPVHTYSLRSRLKNLFFFVFNKFALTLAFSSVHMNRFQTQLFAAF